MSDSLRLPKPEPTGLFMRYKSASRFVIPAVGSLKIVDIEGGATARMGRARMIREMSLNIIL